MNATAIEIQRASCPIQGNPDIYGLGIRLGLYLQMLTAQISGLGSVFLPVPDIVGQGVVMFVLATGTVLVRLILRHEIEAVEVFLIMGLLVCHHSSCRVPFHKYPFTSLIYTGESICLLVLFAWFWFHGMDTMSRSCVDDYAFFFAKVSIWHWFRKLNKAIAVIGIVGATPGVIFYLFWAVVLLLGRKRWKEWGLYRKESKFAGGSFEASLNIGVIVFAEMTVRWNHISGVNSLNSPGQYMPFFIALAQTLTTIYQLLKETAYQKDRISRFLGTNVGGPRRESMDRGSSSSDSDFGLDLSGDQEDSSDTELECPHKTCQTGGVEDIALANQ